MISERTCLGPTAAIVLLSLITGCASPRSRAAVVYLSDFGVRDGAVAAMKGVARGVDPSLVLEDLSHGIRPFDVWEAAYRLRQTAPFWPPNTVFVAVVDPGVGTPRKSIAARTESGHTFIAPDNGLLTLVDDVMGITEVREIDAALRRPGSEQSATFHGRDVYSLTGAMLASGRLAFEQVGRPLDRKELVRLDYPQTSFRLEGAGPAVFGMIPVLDSNFGNVWTDVPAELALDFLERDTRLLVTIRHQGEVVYRAVLPLNNSFGDVPQGTSLVYANSLGNLSFAVNQGSFADTFGIRAGRDWSVEIRNEPSGL